MHVAGDGASHCFGALCVRRFHRWVLMAVQRLGRQNAAQASSTGAGTLPEASGEVNAWLTGCL